MCQAQLGEIFLRTISVMQPNAWKLKKGLRDLHVLHCLPIPPNNRSGERTKQVML